MKYMNISTRLSDAIVAWYAHNICVVLKLDLRRDPTCGKGGYERVWGLGSNSKSEGIFVAYLTDV